MDEITNIAMEVREGLAKKAPHNPWKGVYATGVNEGVTYEGLIFPKRDNTIKKPAKLQFA